MSRCFDVVVERDQDGLYVASVPALRGCHTQATSLDALMERIRESIELCLEVEAARSLRATEDLEIDAQGRSTGLHFRVREPRRSGTWSSSASSESLFPNAALKQLGFEVVRTKGSHSFLRHADGRATVVPVSRRRASVAD